MILKAQLSDLDAIHNLTQACAKAMIANDIYQWNEHYPTRERFIKDITLQELYIFKEAHTIKGIIVLTEVIDEEYLPIKWLTSNAQNLYVHRLAVHPDYWSMGYAKKLMNYAETYAQQHQYQSVRLDTFSKNQKNQQFYVKRVYQRLGIIYFPKHSDAPFYCYELVL